MAKKGNNIFKDAAAIREKHPRRFETWQEYVAQASAIYASKHKGKSPVGHKHPAKKKSMPRKKTHHRKKVHHRPAARRRRIGAGSGISTSSRRHTDYNRNKVYVTVGAVNKHKKMAREKLEHLIAKEEVAKFKAPKKSVKKKHAKKIAKYKSDYRRLSI